MKRNPQLIRIEPSFLFIIYLSCIFLRPWEIFAGSDGFFDLKWLPQFLLGITGVTTLFDRFSASTKSYGKMYFNWNKTYSIVAALLIWILLTTFKSADLASNQSLFFASIFRSIMIFFLILYFVRTHRDYLNLIRGVTIALFTLTGFAVTQNISSHHTASRLQSAGLFADPNDLASILIMTLPLAMRLLKPFGRFGVTILWAYAILRSSSRGALLGLGTLAISYTLMRFSGFRQRFSVLGLALALLGLFSKNMHRDVEDLDQSASSRANYWRAGINMTLHQPFLGVGFGNYPIEFERYAPEILYEWGERTAHSTWILILAETGIVGAGLFILITFAALKRAWAARFHRPELLLSLLGYGTCMSFLSHTYTLFPWFLFGIIFASTQEASPTYVPQAVLLEKTQ